MGDATIEKVVEDLRKELDSAKLLKYIKNPLAYALYQVWKKYDRR